MKNIIIALFCLLSWSSIAQKSFQGEFTTALSTEKIIFEEKLKEYELVQFETSELVQHLTQAQTTTSINLALGSHRWDLTLNEYQLFATDGHFILDGIDVNQVRTFQGYLDGHPERFARIVLVEDYVLGVIHDGKEQFEIVPAKRFLPQHSRAGQYLIYRSADQHNENEGCNNSIASQESIAEAQVKQASSCPDMNVNFNTRTLNNTCQQIEFAIDVDPPFLNNTGGGLSTFFAWMIPFLGAEGLYASTFDISFIISNVIYYNTTNNPYTGVTNPTVLNPLIAATWAGNTTISRDAILLFTGIGFCPTVSGSASGIGDFCTVPNPNFWVSDCGLMGGVVVAHELGHLLNASHPANNCGAFPPNPCNYIPKPLMCLGSCSPTLSMAGDPGNFNKIKDHLDNSAVCLSRPTATIIGPNVLCPPHTGPATYSLNWAGTGTFTTPSILWTSGPGLSLTSAGNTLNGEDFNIDPLYSGTTWVKVTITSNGCTYAYQRNVVVNPNVQLSVQSQGFYSQCTDNNTFFIDMCPPDQISITAFLPGISNAAFSFSCFGGVSCTSTGSNSLSINVPSGVTGFGVTVNTTNQESCSNGRTFVFSESFKCTDYDFAEQPAPLEQTFRQQIKDLKLFPNPIANQEALRIELPANEHPYTVRLLDMQGRVLKEVQTTDQTFNWSMNDWSPGVYWIQASNEDLSLVKKLVISD